MDIHIYTKNRKTHKNDNSKKERSQQGSEGGFILVISYFFKNRKMSQLYLMTHMLKYLGMKCSKICNIL